MTIEEKSFTVPREHNAIAVTVGRDGVWLHFSASNGMHYSMIVSGIAHRSWLEGWLNDMAALKDASEYARPVAEDMEDHG